MKLIFFFFFKQKTAYEIVSRDWSSDVCSSDLASGTLFDWSVPATDAGNTTLAITPTGATTVGGTKTITATFTGLAAAKRYMGAVDYNDGSSTIGRTLLRVNTP